MFGITAHALLSRPISSYYPLKLKTVAQSINNMVAMETKLNFGWEQFEQTWGRPFLASTTSALSLGRSPFKCEIITGIFQNVEKVNIEVFDDFSTLMVKNIHTKVQFSPSCSSVEECKVWKEHVQSWRAWQAKNILSINFLRNLYFVMRYRSSHM